LLSRRLRDVTTKKKQNLVLPRGDALRAALGVDAQVAVFGAAGVVV
jgi:hypothetical protein